MTHTKPNYKIVLGIFLMLGYVFYFYSIRVCAAEENNVELVLDMYFSQRENEFVGEEGTNELVIASSEEINRRNFIENWASELNIEIVESSVEYYIENVLDDKDLTLKIQVYEWVWIDYICNEDEESSVETMGFGTHHIIELDKGVGLSLHSDSYMEITGYETGTMENLNILRDMSGKAIDVETEDIILGDTDFIVPMGVSASYSPGTAVSYSNSWCGQSNAGSSSSMNPNNYNPLYYYYSGADCCNFVSQCLKAGGMSTEGEWTVTTNTSNAVTEDTNYSKSGSAWRYVPSFETYWVGKGHVKQEITNASQAAMGNVIYYLKADGYSSNHIMLIVGTNANGQVLINGHNNDAYRYPLSLSSRKYYTIEFAHCFTNVKSYTATKHVLSCSLCGETKSESHTFATTVDGKTCVVCGYSTTK